MLSGFCKSSSAWQRRSRPYWCRAGDFELIQTMVAIISDQLPVRSRCSVILLFLSTALCAFPGLGELGAILDWIEVDALERL